MLLIGNINKLVIVYLLYTKVLLASNLLFYKDFEQCILFNTHFVIDLFLKK